MYIPRLFLSQKMMPTFCEISEWAKQTERIETANNFHNKISKFLPKQWFEYTVPTPDY